MKIGYACLTKAVYNTAFKTINLKSLTEEKLLDIIDYNLNILENIIDYNIKMDIKLFRISSDIIPFGSSSANQLAWESIFKEKFEVISNKIRENNIRVSMHPGQYTVLNSPKQDVVERAVEDLDYHNRFLDALRVDKTSKIILHIGGVYGDKEAAIGRFEENYKDLSQGIKDRLIIENDDKSYNLGDVLAISLRNDIPVVFDNLHNELLAFDSSKDDAFLIDLVSKTWKDDDGPQKIHYSQSGHGKRPGSHSQTIDLQVFKDFVESITDVDIMLEVKDKNLSALKAKNLLKEKATIKDLEEEWKRYKYNILEHDQDIYKKIRELLKDKNTYPVIEFYNLIDRALATEPSQGSAINASSHVWGYFKDLATEKEKKKYASYMEAFKRGSYSISAVKKILLKMAEKYDNIYLLESYYFYF